MPDTVVLATCGAPLAHRVDEIAEIIRSSGREVAVCPTPTASSPDWVGHGPRPASPPRRPAAVIVCPLTLNTLSGWAIGRNDNAVLGVLNDAIGTAVPTLAVPMVAHRLARHPAYQGHLQVLAAAGVTFMDVTTSTLGDPQPVSSGSGADVAAAFAPSALVTWLDQTLA